MYELCRDVLRNVPTAELSIRKQLRDVYGNDAMMLIAVGQTIATEFVTIAAANNYWEK